LGKIGTNTLNFILVAIPLIENDVYAGENYLPPNKDILPLIDLSLILNESTLAYISEKSINPKSVKKLKEIGHGHFGKVYKGKFCNYCLFLQSCLNISELVKLY
jgi:hypothetical protein